MLAGAAGASEAWPTFRTTVRASDGVELALYRYPPRVPSSAPPVLLVPELGFSREVFELDGAGLARFLQRRGREVFVLEPRGHGASGGGDWALADLVTRDLPAALEAIAGVRVGEVDLVAHGYSGALLLAATTQEVRQRIRAVVAIATPVLAEVPNEVARTALSLDQGFGRDPRRFHLLFTRGGRFDEDTLSALRAAALRPLSRRAARELLSWMERGELPLTGERDLLTARFAAYDRPTLLLLPLTDNFAHPEFASPLRELAPAEVTVRLLTRLSLLREDYTHLSVIAGKDAARDIFVPLLAHLDGVPEPRPSTAEETP